MLSMVVVQKYFRIIYGLQVYYNNLVVPVPVSCHINNNTSSILKYFYDRILNYFPIPHVYMVYKRSVLSTCISINLIRKCETLWR